MTTAAIGKKIKNFTLPATGDQVISLGDHEFFQLWAKRHRHIGRGHAFDRGIEGIETLLGDQGRQLGTWRRRWVSRHYLRAVPSRCKAHFTVVEAPSVRPLSTTCSPRRNAPDWPR